MKSFLKSISYSLFNYFIKCANYYRRHIKLQTANFNIIIPRKLTIPNNEEIAFGAVMLDGMTYLNHNLEVPSKYIEIEKLKQIQEIKRRLHLYLGLVVLR